MIFLFKKKVQILINNKKRILFFVFFIFFFCSSNDTVKLSIDFSTQNKWYYAINVEINGYVKMHDTSYSIKNNAVCTLVAMPDSFKKDIVHMKAEYVSFYSNFLSENEISNLIQQAQEAKFTCSFKNGIFLKEDSSFLPVVQIGEWDIFKDIIKTIPTLPESKVKKGTSWYREKEFPLDTKHGTATAYLMQWFWLDSIYVNKDSKKFGIIKWKFAYNVNTKADSISSLLKNMPFKGEGVERALINVSKKRLESASIKFNILENPKSVFKASYQENLTLSLVK